MRFVCSWFSSVVLERAQKGLRCDLQAMWEPAGSPGENSPQGAQNTLNAGAVMFGVGCSLFFALMQLLSVESLVFKRSFPPGALL